MMYRLMFRCLLIFGLLGCVAGSVQAAITADFNADSGVFRIESDAADDIVIDCEFFVIPALESTRGGGDFFVTVNHSLPPSADVPCADVGTFVINGGPGDNFIDFVGGLDPEEFTALLNTMITAGPGSDEIFGTFTNDNNFWGPGAGSDTFDGRDGHDAQGVEGGDNGETFTIGNGVEGFDVRFERTGPTPFSIDIVNAEALQVGGNGGDDIIDAGALGAGRIRLILFGDAGDDSIVGSSDEDFINGGPGNDSLAGGPGADTIQGLPGDDVNIWNPGDGSDTFDGGEGEDRQIVNGGEGADPFFIGPNDPDSGFFPEEAVDGFEVLFKRDPGLSSAIRGSEILEVRANDGNDIIDAGALPAGLISLQLLGEDGDDEIIGSEGSDNVDGGPGQDTLIGGRGNDTVRGGSGHDLMVWNPGDGSDINDGDAGIDSSLVNGSSAAETFAITTGNPGFDARFDRAAPAPFGIDIVNVENILLLAGDGLDTVTTAGFPGIGQFLDGGDPDTFPGDNLTVLGFEGDLSRTPVVNLPNADPVEHLNFEFAPAGVGALELAPDPLDFGAGNVGEIIGPLELALSNTGTAEINVTGVSAPAAPFAGAGGSCGGAPFILAEGASCTLAYTFAPTEAGAAAGTVTVTSDAGNGPQHGAVLSGTGSEEEGGVPAPDPVAIPALGPGMLLLLVLLLAAFVLSAVRRMN